MATFFIKLPKIMKHKTL